MQSQETLSGYMEIEFDHGHGLRFERPVICALVYYESDIAEVVAQFQQENPKFPSGQERVLDSTSANGGLRDLPTHLLSMRTDKGPRIA